MHIYIRTYTCSNTVCTHQMHELDTLRKKTVHLISPVQFQCSWPQLFNDGFIQLRLCFDRATQIFVAVFWRAINLWDENLQR